ncbi:MAG: ferredoxin family protein [Aureliella sp.]
MPNQLTVIVSAGQSRNPKKRELESGIAEGAAQLSGVSVLKIPHLYDLKAGGQTFETLQKLSGDLVICSWLYDRATHWILDRNGVRGQVGEVELLSPDRDDDEPSGEQEPDERRVTDAQPRPDRKIYCIEYRASESPDEFVNEIRRIATLSNATTNDKVTQLQIEHFGAPENDTYVGAPVRPAEQAEAPATLAGTAAATSIDESPTRRWYPVIDFSRCTNCMECIDFCLFGVYGVDTVETILVEQPDNCRKGCPACSRVCPQNAIIFPQHKSPAIAGAPVEGGGLKIDLSKLFGAPETDEDAADVAARERDEQLILAGRKPVGSGNAILERLEETKKASSSKDDLDGLIDELDALDL